MTASVIATIVNSQYNTSLNDDVVTSLRINVSHCTLDHVVDVVTALSKHQYLKRIYLDLQGPKLRLSKKQPKCDVLSSSTVPILASTNFVTNDGPCIVLDEREIEALTDSNVTHASIDDGKVLVEVSMSAMTAVVTRGGTLRPSKGINISPHPAVRTLTDKDLEVVRATCHFPFVAYALSFTRTADDITFLRQYAPTNFIAAKIELPLSLEALEGLVPVVDEFWLCRGDLGSQLGLKQLAVYYKMFKDFARKHSDVKEKFIMAGEVLDHMTDNLLPTRSEVCHLSDVLDNFGGIVLSNETAYGKNVNGIIAFLKSFL
ncbi:hypothetical protein GEMRC1_002520 [Eukaryota sp. GEM-RC1]